MHGDLRVDELLEEILEHDRTPEEVCRDAPELLAQVRDRLRQVRALQRDVDVLLPSASAIRVRRGASGAELGAEFPRIVGYEVQEVLGRGGVGIVYKAWHVRLQRTIALKMLLAGEFAVPQELARFSREAEVVASLKHPNVVQIHDVGDHNGRPYFTMEFVEGGSLANKLAGTPLAASDAASIVAALAEAMHVAHIGGVVHRDLKPANVLLALDGTPKITDFGLARKLDGTTALTLSGVSVGTPSYMAPEQAQGDARAIGPAVDIYALGALLYEMLTGRPPFRAATPLETQLQVITQEPVTPSSLNAQASRDLETISLKCLHKDPSRRYSSAAELSADLHRFLRGEPIRARPTGPFERASKWARRRPARAVSLASGVLLVMAVTGFGVATGLKRAAIVREVEDRLVDVGRFEQRSAWSDARARLDLAKLQLGSIGPEALHRRLDRAHNELDLVARLDDIRLRCASIVGGVVDKRINNARADHEYEAALNDAEFGSVDDKSQVVAARIASSNIHGAVVASLDDWTLCTTDVARRRWLLDVARVAEPASTPWRERVRDPDLWNDKVAMVEMADGAQIADESVLLLVTLAKRIKAAGGDATAFLKRLQEAHPDDAWVNFELGDSLRSMNSAEAVGYYQAALAARPDTVVALNNLGRVLAMNHRTEEALHCMRRAIAIDPTFGPSYTFLGNCFSLAGRNDEAIVQHQEAIRLGSGYAAPHQDLGQAFAADGRWDEAIEQFRLAIAIDSGYAEAHSGLCVALTARRNVDEALQHGETSIRLDPSNAVAHVNYGLALQAAARLDEAFDQFERALAIDPLSAEANTFMGQVLLAKGHRNEAVQHYEKALATQPGFTEAHKALATLLGDEGDSKAAFEHARQVAIAAPRDAKVQFNFGLTLHGLGKFDEAIESFQKAVDLDPTLVIAHGALGRTRLSQGRFREALEATQRCLDLLPSSGPIHDEIAGQRERCQSMLTLEERLSDFRSGTDKPADSTELLHFAELLRLKREYLTAAGYFADAFAKSPSLTEDVRAGRRYQAACCAALVGCGKGDDAAADSENDRARWRAQALEWLRADISAHSKVLDGNRAAYASRLQWVLTRWRNDPDLAGLRDDDRLGELPRAERQQCRELWSDVALLCERAKDTD